MPGNPLDVFIAELDVHRFAAVGAASAIDNLKSLLVQLTGQFIGIETIIPVLHAAEKIVVLLIVVFGVLLPVFHYAVVIHVRLLSSSPASFLQ